MATLWKCVAEPSSNPPYTHATHPAKTPLTSDNIDAPAACAVPFRPYCGGVVTQTRYVSEYMHVLALCLVMVALCNRAEHIIFALWFLSSIFFLFFLA